MKHDTDKQTNIQLDNNTLEKFKHANYVNNIPVTFQYRINKIAISRGMLFDMSYKT